MTRPLIPVGLPVIGGATNNNGDLFGWSVAMNGAGTMLVVGSVGYSGAVSNCGGVYTYDRVDGVWVQRGSVLTAADAASFTQFGAAVALSNDGTVLAVGSDLRDGSLSGQGAVYIFDWSGSAWVQRGGVLLAADAASSDAFGTSVALSNDGTVLAVGALNWEGAVSNAGGVYVFDWTGSAWAQRGAVLEGASVTTSSDFGWSLAFNSAATTLAVGEINAVNSGFNVGGVYLYDWSGSAWVQRGAILLNPNPAASSAGDGFGTGVALNDAGTVLAVGSYGTDVLGFESDNAGVVFIYDWSGSAWVQRGSPIQMPGWFPGDLFGASVALSASGALLVAGSWVHSTAVAADVEQGIVHTFSEAYILAGTVRDVDDVLCQRRVMGYRSSTNELIGSVLSNDPTTGYFTMGTPYPGEPHHAVALDLDGGVLNALIYDWVSPA